jgi:hypothetical protein
MFSNEDNQCYWSKTSGNCFRDGFTENQPINFYAMFYGVKDVQELWNWFGEIDQILAAIEYI